jgi:enoyl-CoA hydratase
VTVHVEERGKILCVTIDRPDHRMGPTRMQCSKPVIAAIEGYAVAGGLELAIWCDLRVAAESSTFGVFCRRWGVPLIDGGTVRLPRLVGLGRALDLILTGRPVDAEEALRIGLVERVVPDGSARNSALELAAQIARFPQECLIADRDNAFRAFDQPIPDALRRELETSMPAVRSCVAGARTFADGEGRGGTFELNIPETK